MEVTVEASVLIAVIGDEAEKPILIKKAHEPNLIAPASIHWEVGNAFSACRRWKSISKYRFDTLMLNYLKHWNWRRI